MHDGSNISISAHKVCDKTVLHRNEFFRLTKEGQNLKEEQFFPAEEVSAPLNGNLDQVSSRSFP